MIRLSRRGTLLPLLSLLLTLVVAGCDQPLPTEQPAPSEQQEFLGGLLGGGPAGFTPVREPLLGSLLGTVSSVSSGLLGVAGGTVSLLGHSITVPAGAVSQPTLFSIIALPTGYVEVELGATLQSVLGTVLNIGGQGFDKPVPVTLTYARGTNVKDPSKLKILRINSVLGYRSYEVMPSRVDPVKKTVTADLDHFSRYLLAYP